MSEIASEIVSETAGENSFEIHSLTSALAGEIGMDALTTFRIRRVADSIPRLKRFPSGCVDVVLTDPPYSPHVHENLVSGSLLGTNGKKKSVPKYDLSFAPMTDWSWMAPLARAVRRWTIVFCCLEDLGAIRNAAPDAYVRGGIWIKPNAMGQLTRDRPATSYEAIAFLHNPITRMRWDGHGRHGTWVCNGTRGKAGRHPNEKPLLLAGSLVALFTDPGDVVLDPFCGSGALLEPCVELGRHAIGWDCDGAWVQRARARLAERLFGGEVSKAAMEDQESHYLRSCRLKGKSRPSAMER